MAMLSEQVDVVVGVDTHKHTHTAAIIATANRAVLEIITVPATASGYETLIAAASVHGTTRAWAIEGTRTYGTGLVRAVQRATTDRVIEVDRPKRPPRRNGAKTDTIDAERCAREALTNTIQAQPRTGDQRDALAMLTAARDAAVEASKVAQTQPQSFIVTAPEHIAVKVRDAPTPRQRWNRCVKLRHHNNEGLLDETTINVLVATARRILALEAEANQHEKTITTIVTDWRGDLLDLVGVGPITAATILCAWSHPGRFRSDAAFAMLAGVAPIPASSGMTVRHRLNRRGDRQLNRALHTIALTRLRHDPTTKAYVERRTTQGKRPPEIRRCLKRYIARQIFHQLENPPKTT